MLHESYIPFQVSFKVFIFFSKGDFYDKPILNLEMF